VELGLLNVAQDVWIKATDIENATQTFVIPASGISSQKKGLLDVLLAIEEARRGGCDLPRKRSKMENTKKQISKINRKKYRTMQHHGEKRGK
jgi:hypothetical protein